MPEPIETPPAPETPPATPPQNPPPDEPKLFTQAELNAKLAKERKDTETKVKNDLAAEQTRKQAEADEARLKEQGEWQRVAEQKDDELKALRASVDAANLNALRIKAGAKYKLPDEITARLIGTTEDELSKDAEKMAKLLPPPVPGNTQNGGVRTIGNGGEMTKAQQLEQTQREQAQSGRYNF